MFCPRARTHTHDCAFQFRQWCGAEETASLSERRREWESSGEKEEIKKKKEERRSGKPRRCLVDCGFMGIGGWRKSAGGRLSEVGERWVRGTGVWLVLVPPPLLFSQSSSSRSSQLFLAHYLVRHRRLPGRRREELSSLSLADSRRQSCPALLILINTHFFKPLQHTHTH